MNNNKHDAESLGWGTTSSEIYKSYKRDQRARITKRIGFVLMYLGVVICVRNIADQFDGPSTDQQVIITQQLNSMATADGFRLEHLDIDSLFIDEAQTNVAESTIVVSDNCKINNVKIEYVVDQDMSVLGITEYVIPGQYELAFKNKDEFVAIAGTYPCVALNS